MRDEGVVQRTWSNLHFLTVVLLKTRVPPSTSQHLPTRAPREGNAQEGRATQSWLNGLRALALNGGAGPQWACVWNLFLLQMKVSMASFPAEFETHSQTGDKATTPAPGKRKHKRQLIGPAQEQVVPNSAGLPQGFPGFEIRSPR